MEKKYWYAVEVNDDFDWGYGSYDYAEAKRMAQHYLDNGDQVIIATIDESENEPMCINKEKLEGD